MPDFSKRSTQTEIMDDPALGADDLRPVLIELDKINRLLGGYNLLYDAFEKLGKPQALHICDWGCGGGDTLIKLDEWAAKQKLGWHFTGIDFSPVTAEYARHNTKNHNKISIAEGDVMHAEMPLCDVVVSNLFTHHFADDDWVTLIRRKMNSAQKAVVINDLHRHPLAYFAITFLTRLLSRSYMVRNDAPLSVLRGFRKKELILLLKKAGVTQYRLRWKWAFRWQLIIYTAAEKPVSA